MVKNDDYAITPLFDEKGIIAGLQVNVSVIILGKNVASLTRNCLLAYAQ